MAANLLALAVFELIAEWLVGGWTAMRDVERAGLAGAAVCAVVLAVAADLHGVSLVSGMAAMALLLLADR